MRDEILTAMAKREQPKGTVRTFAVWAIMRGDGGGQATQRLYLFHRAMNVCRRAQRMGMDVYISAAGRLTVTDVEAARMRRR